MTKTTTNCGKCKGTGRLSEYAHIAEGVCFRCQGSGKVAAPSAAAVARNATREAAEIARREAHRAAFQAKIDAAMAVYGNDARVLSAHPDCRHLLAIELMAKYGA